MPSTVQVGTILMKEWAGMPLLIGLETEPGLGEWRMVKVPDALSLDREIHAAGWNLFFMAAEVKTMFFESVRAPKVQSALKQILAKVKRQHFNGLEVTAIVACHFLGVPYVTVFAHSRHMQRSCNMGSAERRQTSQDNAGERLSCALSYRHLGTEDASQNNFCHVHSSLRVTSAMESGTANHVWSMEEPCCQMRHLPRSGLTRESYPKSTRREIA